MEELCCTVLEYIHEQNSEYDDPSMTAINGKLALCVHIYIYCYGVMFIGSTQVHSLKICIICIYVHIVILLMLKLSVHNTVIHLAMNPHMSEYSEA